MSCAEPPTTLKTASDLGSASDPYLTYLVFVGGELKKVYAPKKAKKQDLGAKKYRD